jgi:hypothetical protein
MEMPVSNEKFAPLDQSVGSIRLQIAGADLLLSGRFEQWMPVRLHEGDDREPATAQILFDVTSNRSRRQGKDLLTFKSRSVETVGPQTYRLKGTLEADGHSGPVEAMLQNPPGHTPFFLIMFRIDRTSYPTLFDAFEDRVARVQTLGQDELRPRAWLRAPELAAA